MGSSQRDPAATPARRLWRRRPSPVVWVVTAVIAVATLAPASASASEWVRCALSTKPTSCCCPRVTGQEPSRLPAVRVSTCCSSELAPATPPAPRAVHGDGPAAAVVPVAIAAVDVTAPAPVVTVVPAWTPRPGRAPPLFVQHCALLH